MDTQVTRQESEAVANAVAPGDLLQFITYEADPPIFGDPADPTAEARRRFVGAALTDALAAGDQAVNGTREAVLAGPGTEEPEAGATVQFHGLSLDVALQADELLEDLVGLYALGGWSEVRAAADQLLAFADVEAARAGAMLVEAGRPPDPQRVAGWTTSDRSGYPPTEADVATAEGDVERWRHTREAVDAALGVLAASILDGLDALEKYVDEQATVRANLARNGAAAALVHYQPVRYYKSTNDVKGTPIWGYRFGEAEASMARPVAPKAPSPVSDLRKFVEPLYARVEQVRRAELDLREARMWGDSSGDTTRLEKVMQELAVYQPMLAKELAEVGRSQHPWAVPLALSIPRLSDEELAGCLYQMVHDIIDVTEEFAADKASLVATLRSEAVWPEVLRDGPEQALLARLPQDGETFEPLASQALVAPSVQVLERTSGQFASTVALYYRRGLADTIRRSQTIAQVVEALGWLFNLALMFIPGGALPAVFEGALFAHGAIQGVRGLLARDEQFRTVLTGTVIEEEGLDWLVELGAVMAERPGDPGLLAVFLAVGIPLSDIAAFVARVDPARLQWLDHIMMIESLI